MAVVLMGQKANPSCCWEKASTCCRQRQSSGLFGFANEIAGAPLATVARSNSPTRGRNTLLLDPIQAGRQNPWFRATGPRLLITPTFAGLAVDNARDGNTKGPNEINGEPVDPLIGWCLTDSIRFTGHPAILILALLSSDNLPIGMQIIGRRDGDADMLAANAASERLRLWADRSLCGWVR